MNVQIRTKDITLTEQTKSHIEAAIEQVNKYQMEVTTINVILAKEKKGVSVEFDMHIAHNNPVVIKQEDGNLDAAIDIAIERASKALRRLHDKVKSHRGAGLKEVELAEE
jgi:ribosomal subunit interface protein